MHTDDTPYTPDTALNPERAFLLHHIGFDKKIVAARGHYVVDDAGTTYLDALAQYGCLPFGHNPQFLWESLNDFRLANSANFVQPLLGYGRDTCKTAPQNLENEFHSAS